MLSGQWSASSPYPFPPLVIRPVDASTLEPRPDPVSCGVVDSRECVVYVARSMRCNDSASKRWYAKNRAVTRRKARGVAARFDDTRPDHNAQTGRTRTQKRVKSDYSVSSRLYPLLPIQEHRGAHARAHVGTHWTYTPRDPGVHSSSASGRALFCCSLTPLFRVRVRSLGQRAPTSLPLHVILCAHVELAPPVPPHASLLPSVPPTEP